MTSWLLFQNSFILRRLTVAIFVDIIKIASIFTKTIVKDSKKFERIRNYVSKWNLYFYFLIQQNCQFPVKKLWHQQNSGCVQPDSYIYCIFFRWGITVLSLIIVGYVWEILGRGTFWHALPHLWAAPKKPILNSVNSETLLLSDVFENFIKMCLEISELNPANIYMLLMVEKGTRGGMCTQFIDMQKLIVNIWNILIKLTNHHT